MADNPVTDNNNATATPAATKLCASCDKCRARKTKCDGQRPCGNCVAWYKKIYKGEESIEGVDVASINCVYSLAKRRGPVPSRSSTHRQLENSSTPDNVTLPGGMMEGLCMMMGQPQGVFPSSLTDCSGAIPTGGTYDYDKLAGGMMNTNTLDSSIASAGGVRCDANSINSSNTLNFSFEELSLLMAIQQQQGITQLNQNYQHNQQPQLPDGMMGGISVGGMTKQTGNSVATGSYTSRTTADFQNIPAGITAAHVKMELQEKQQPNHLTSLYQNTKDNDHYDRSAKRIYQNQPTSSSINGTDGRIEATSSMTSNTANDIPIAVARHIPILHPNSTDGAVLRSYYELSTNDVLNLPPIPTDEEYLVRLSSLPNSNCCHQTNTFPTFDQSALRAARFAELALGALANEQVSLAQELSYASAFFLRRCVNKPAHPSCLYDVSRAYLLLGIFRSFRGDLLRYFKYRKACMYQVMKLDASVHNKIHPHVEALLAAISFHDAWCYLHHNGSVDNLPDIDSFLPRLSNTNNTYTDRTKLGNSINASSIVSDPLNQLWMQGSPPIFLNNEANLVSRSIDAFSCAVRSCCDIANTSVDEIVKASGLGLNITSMPLSPTYTAILANESELCSRNIVISAKTLLDQHRIISAPTTKKYGLDFVAHAMIAFLEDGENNELQLDSGEDESSVAKFTPVQIKNLFAACDIIIQHPLLLHSPGPLYHMASNAAILLCHLLNAIYVQCHSEAAMHADNNNFSGNNPPVNMVNSRLFDNALDTFMAMRRLLHYHRKILPLKLRCHGLPRPSGLGLFKKPMERKKDNDLPRQESYIDVGETLMCLCRGCQGFVLMGCSPCVAAERMVKVTQKTGIQDTDNFLEFLEGFHNDDQFENSWSNETSGSSTDDELLDMFSTVTDL